MGVNAGHNAYENSNIKGADEPLLSFWRITHIYRILCIRQSRSVKYRSLTRCRLCCGTDPNLDSGILVESICLELAVLLIVGCEAMGII